MRAFLKITLALVGLTCFASAQDAVAEYQREFQKGIAALSAGNHDEGIRAFERCLELQPKDPISAYNIACGRALKGEADKAFEWLDKSAEWGFGNIEGNIAHAQKDEDLVSLREDPRFTAYIDRMKALLLQVQAFVRTAAVHLPKAIERAEEVGLLVVLHDRGQTKMDVLQSDWRAVAEELGLVLIAPSGLHAIEGEPEKGMAFVRNLADYVQRPWVDEKPVIDAVEAFRKTRAVDRARVFLAGEGASAAVAFNTAVSSPGLFRGVVLSNGLILPELSAVKAANAAKMGLVAQMVLREGAPGLPTGPALQTAAEGIRAHFNTWSMSLGMILIPPADYHPDTFAKILSTAVQNVAEPTTVPAEAGSTPH